MRDRSKKSTVLIELVLRAAAIQSHDNNHQMITTRWGRRLELSG